MGLGFGNVLRPGNRTGPAPIWIGLVIHLFTQQVKYPVRYLVNTYRWRDHAWHLHRVAEHELPPAVVAWYHAWPTLAEKRQQSAIQRRELLRLRRAV